MADYIYNPAESIKQSLGQAASGIGEIFTSLIAQQQRDNSIAEKAFLNIEALKKDVNIYGQKVITEKANNLLKDASSAIFKNGKLDYSKLGEIRQQISNISDENKKYALGADMRKEVMQLMLANKDNITNFEKALSDVTNVIVDPNIKNATDMQSAMMKAYDNNLDLDRMGTKAILAVAPLEPKKAQVINKNKDEITYDFTGIKGSQFDSNTGKVILPPAEEMAAITQSIKARMPDYFDRYRQRVGVNSDFLSDDAITQKLASTIQTPVTAVRTGRAAQFAAEEAGAESAKFKVATQKQAFDMEMRLKESQIAENMAQEMRALAGTKKGDTPSTSLRVTPRSIPLKDRSGRVVPGKTQTVYDMALPKPFSMDFPGTKDYEGGGKEIGALKVISVTKGADGNFVLSGYKVDKSKLDASNPFSEIPTSSDKLMNVKLNRGQYDAFINRVQGFAKEDTQNVMGGLEGMKKNIVDLDSFR